MHWIVLVGAFFVFWFLALQIVLPIGNRTAHEAGEALVAGTDPSAPVKPQLGLKLTLATVAAVVMWGILYALVLTKVLDL
jgi:predicted secreted protein